MEVDIRIFGIVVFFVRYFSNFATSVRYFVLSIQAVSVFIEFSTRYCSISRFFPWYCGSEYPANVPLSMLSTKVTNSRYVQVKKLQYIYNIR